MNDAEIILMKGCSYLRLTNEIRLAVFMSERTRTSLRLIVEPHCRLSEKLEEFLEDHEMTVERMP